MSDRHPADSSVQNHAGNDDANHQKARLRAAALRATRLYPGPVGEVLTRELLTWEEFGHRLGGHRLIMRLVDHVLTTPLTQTEVA